MKIHLDGEIVKFAPENELETAYMEALWVKMGNCVGGDKKLAPIGVYEPTQKNEASFLIEGLSAEEIKTTVIRAPYDTDVYCQTCNRVEHVKKGEPIPVCCGKVMEILD